MTFDVRIDVSSLQRRAIALAELPDKARSRVISRTVATLRRRLGTETRKFVSEQFGIGVQAIGRRVTTSSDANSVSVYGTTGKVPLGEFGGRYGGRLTAGATAQILRDGSRQTYKSAFIIKGRKTILARKLLAGGKRAARFPLVRLHGPTVESMVLGGGAFANADTPAVRASKVAGEIFDAEIDRLIAVELKS